MMNGPFRKPTFTPQPPLNLFDRSGPRNNSYLYPGDPGFEDRGNRFGQKIRKLYRRHQGNFGGYLVVLIMAVFFLGWCWMLWTGDIQITDLNSCPEGSQRIHGWSNGRYTNLCIDPVRR